MAHKKPIAPILKKMSVGDCEIYPIYRKVSIISTRDRFKAIYPTRQYSINNVDDWTVQVTRTK